MVTRPRCRAMVSSPLRGGPSKNTQEPSPLRPRHWQRATRQATLCNPLLPPDRSVLALVLLSVVVDLAWAEFDHDDDSADFRSAQAHLPKLPSRLFVLQQNFPQPSPAATPDPRVAGERTHGGSFLALAANAKADTALLMRRRGGEQRRKRIGQHRAAMRRLRPVPRLTGLSLGPAAARVLS